MPLLNDISTNTLVLPLDMNPIQLKALGITLGIAVLVITFLHFWRTFQEGSADWYFLVMACGMALLLLYTFTSSKKKRR